MRFLGVSSLTLLCGFDKQSAICVFVQGRQEGIAAKSETWGLVLWRDPARAPIYYFIYIMTEGWFYLNLVFLCKSSLELKKAIQSVFTRNIFVDKSWVSVPDEVLLICFSFRQLCLMGVSDNLRTWEVMFTPPISSLSWIETYMSPTSMAT